MSSGSVMEGDVVAEFAKNFGVAHFDGKTETLGEFRLHTTMLGPAHTKALVVEQKLFTVDHGPHQIFVGLPWVGGLAVDVLGRSFEFRLRWWATEAIRN